MVFEVLTAADIRHEPIYSSAVTQGDGIGYMFGPVSSNRVCASARITSRKKLFS